MQTIITFFREARAELAKVAWPTKDQVVRNTMLVVLVTCIAALFLGGLDYMFSYFVKVFILK